MEFEHLLHVLCIYHKILVFVILGHCERTKDVYLRAINGSKECSNNDVALILRLTEEVIQYVWGDRGVDQAVKRLYRQAEVQVR